MIQVQGGLLKVIKRPVSGGPVQQAAGSQVGRQPASEAPTNIYSLGGPR